MAQSKVAKRYAKAWFDLAKERDVHNDVFNDFQTVRNIARDSRELARMFFSPVVKTAKKIVVLRAVFTGNVTLLTLQFMEMLTEKGREIYLTEIAEAYTELYLADKNIVVADVTIAVPLDDEMRNKIKSIVNAQTGKEVQLRETVNADIIGGFILRVGDKETDTSIRTKLKHLGREFKGNRYLAKASA